jgi:hypothetical protein
MRRRRTIVERRKEQVLAELHLMRPADLEAHWRQVKWPKPNLVELAKNKSGPLASALTALNPEILAQASAQLDPFGWLLAAVDLREWRAWCGQHHVPWMSRVWLAAASQLRAELRLIHKAHGWSDTWAELRRNPKSLRKAEDFYFAQLTHAPEQRRNELLAIPVLEPRLARARQAKDEAFLRRLRRAKKGAGKRAGASPAEKYVVQHWLELPQGLPGFCFFSDSALDSVLNSFGLGQGKSWATKQTRVRLGLIQAGALRHLIEDVIALPNELRFTGSMVQKPWTFTGCITSGKRRLWPR